MSVPVLCVCGSRYDLKDQYLGVWVRCPKCGATQVAGERAAVAATPVGRVFGRDLYLLRQKTFTIHDKYFITDERGRPLLFVERPAHATRKFLAAMGGLLAGLCTYVVWGLLTEVFDEGPIFDAIVIMALPVCLVVGLATGYSLGKKRHVSFFRGTDGSSPRVLQVLQDQKLSFPTRSYTVIDETGASIGVLSKNYLYNIFRKQWLVRDGRGRPVCVVKEDSIVLSLLRRLIFFGMLRTNFVFLQFGTEQNLGEFRRRFTILDRYVLDLSHDRIGLIDRRLAVATAVMLDTAERR